MRASQSILRKSIPGFTVKQEPGTGHEAQEFACTRFKAEYPIFYKARVNGANISSVCKFLKAQKTGFMRNFTKFLVDKNGCVMQRFGTTTSQLATEDDVKKALDQF